MTSSLSSHTDIQGTLLTREQVEEISTRISKIVSENISKQLEKSMASEESFKDK